MSTYGSRIEALRKYKDKRKTQEEFANELGFNVTQTLVSKWEKITEEVYYGKNVLIFKTRFPNLNEKWLQTGEGEMWLDRSHEYRFEEKPTYTVSESEVQYLRLLLEEKEKVIKLQDMLLSEREKREPNESIQKGLG